MKYGNKIWLNGKLVPFEDANVHVMTHALHYSSAVFEGLRCYETPNGMAIFRLVEHVERLFESAKLYSMSIPYTKKQIVDAIVKTVQASGLDECYIRPIAYLGNQTVGLLPVSTKADLAISCADWKTKKYVPVDTASIKCQYKLCVYIHSSNPLACTVKHCIHIAIRYTWNIFADSKSLSTCSQTEYCHTIWCFITSQPFKDCT